MELAPTAPQHQGKPSIQLPGVLVEEEPPPRKQPADPMATPHHSAHRHRRRVVNHYAQRWKIEAGHRMIKSGGNIPGLANRSAKRLERAIAINLVIAWRLFLMTLLGRDHPDWPPELLFSDLELKEMKS